MKTLLALALLTPLAALAGSSTEGKPMCVALLPRNMVPTAHKAAHEYAYVWISNIPEPGRSGEGYCLIIDAKQLPKDIPNPVDPMNHP